MQISVAFRHDCKRKNISALTGPSSIKLLTQIESASRLLNMQFLKSLLDRAMRVQEFCEVMLLGADGGLSISNLLLDCERFERQWCHPA